MDTLKYKIFNNNKELLKGDERTIKVIFNNLSRKNIYGVLYYMYLEMMANEVGLEPGKIQLLNNNNICLEEAIIQFNNPKK